MQEKFPLKGIKGNKKEKIVLLFGNLWNFLRISALFLHYLLDIILFPSIHCVVLTR